MDDIRDQFIAQVVPGKRFVDIGGLWGEVNEKVSVAAELGAIEVTMMDIVPQGHELWHSFSDRVRARSIDAECVTANLNEFDTIAAHAGRFDVVHCSGILYHCPNPLHTLAQLRALAGESVVLTSTVVPERTQSSVGQVDLGEGGLRLVPHLNARDRSIFAAYWNERGVTGIGGLDVDAIWDVSDYNPWWWFLTPSALRQMAEAVGFGVLDEGPFWGGLAHTLLLTTHRA
jgi:hypothetical protein